MGDMTTTTQTERPNRLSIDGDGTITLSNAQRQMGGFRFDGRSLVHPAGTTCTLNAEKTAELAEAVASVRPERYEYRTGCPQSEQGEWEYLGITDESGEFQAQYRRCLDEGSTATVFFGRQDLA